MHRKYQDQLQTMRQKKLEMRKFFFTTSFRIGLLACIAILGVLNVVQIARISTTGYQVNDLQQTIQSLKQEHKKIEVAIATYQSLEHIQTRVQTLNMVPVTERTYIQIPERIVAKK